MHRTLRTLAAAAALAIACGAVPAAAKDLPAKGMTLEEVSAWLKDNGLSVEAKTGKAGKRYLSSNVEGVNFDVEFYDCAAERCTSIQMVAGFDLEDGLTLEKVNAWNSSKRYAKVYVDAENDPYIDYDINLSPGGTREALDDDLGVWALMLTEFKPFIGW